MKKALLICTALSLALTACVRPDQNTYQSKEVGTSRAIVLATVLSVRPVTIKNKDSGVGLIGGGVAGGAAGSASGNGWVTAGGALVGAVAGELVEQNVSQREGFEYILRTDDGDLKTITQNKSDDDIVFKKGDRVMIQYCDSGEHYKRCVPGKDNYQRLLPTDIPPQTDVPVKKHKHHKKAPPPPVDDADDNISPAKE